jgi:hypothetical protein
MPEAENDPIEELYDLLTTELLAVLRTPACKECGTHGLSPQMLTVARQFLSDNEMKRVARSSHRGPKPLAALPFEPGEGEQPVQRKA